MVKHKTNSLNKQSKQKILSKTWIYVICCIKLKLKEEEEETPQ